MPFQPELSPKEKVELAKAHKRWVEEGCLIPDARAYPHSIIEQIARVQPMPDGAQKALGLCHPCVAKEGSDGKQ